MGEIPVKKKATSKGRLKDKHTKDLKVKKVKVPKFVKYLNPKVQIGADLPKSIKIDSESNKKKLISTKSMN